MIKSIIFLGIFFVSHVFASNEVKLEFSSPKAKLGGVETVKVQLTPDLAQKLPLQKLKGQTLSETIYVGNIKPLMKKDGGSFFETEMDLIFLKAPQGNSLVYKLGNEDIIFTWNPLEIENTEVPKGFLFGEFEIPSRPKIFLYGSIILGLILLIILGRKLKQKIDSKNHKKKMQKEFKAVVLNANSYEDIVSVWKKKSALVLEFPFVNDAFKDFEITLYKYQFKPKQSEAEKQLVVEAYQVFKQKISGGLNGI